MSRAGRHDAARLLWRNSGVHRFFAFVDAFRRVFVAGLADDDHSEAHPLDALDALRAAAVVVMRGAATTCELAVMAGFFVSCEREL